MTNQMSRLLDCPTCAQTCHALASNKCSSGVLLQLYMCGLHKISVLGMFDDPIHSYPHCYFCQMSTGRRGGMIYRLLLCMDQKQLMKRSNRLYGRCSFIDLESPPSNTWPNTSQHAGIWSFLLLPLLKNTGVPSQST